jgi:membrane peptidoglycan carboxypeptidase
VFGGTIPARIWDAFMTQALAPLPDAQFTQPDESFWPAHRYIAMTGRDTAAPPAPPPTVPPVTTTVPAKPTPTTVPKKTHPPAHPPTSGHAP